MDTFDDARGGTLSSLAFHREDLTMVQNVLTSDSHTLLLQEQDDVFADNGVNSSANSSDLSFLNRRSNQSCSQMAHKYRRTRTPSVSDVVSSTTASSTPRRSSITSHSSTPTAKTSLHHQPQSEQKKRRLDSISMARQRSASSAGARSYTSKASSAKVNTALANTKRLPLRLPKPPLCVISDPYADLCAHVRRYGMETEAEQFAQAQGITPDYVLQASIETTPGGATALLNQTSVFLSRHAQPVESQMKQVKEEPSKVSIPKRFSIPVGDLDQAADDYCLTPTHILAVHGTTEGANNERGLLMPCHALIYVLQCVSLPAFATSTAGQDGETVRQLPTVMLRVPRPQDFPLLHRYIYTHDASALLVELLPMRHIAKYLDQAKDKQQADLNYSWDMQYANQPMPLLPPPTNTATEALSHLPIPSLFGYAMKIHATWANAVAIGFLDKAFWSTLDRAWCLVIAALACKKARIMDTEKRGVKL